MKKYQPTLEIACGSAWDAIEAAAGGADRVEFCSAMFLGGLTPSYGSFVTARRDCRIPMYVMLRPREASFAYNDYEYNVIKEDAKIFLEAGAEGLVLGLLTPDNDLDLERLKDFRETFPDAELVFHRAFDIVNDWRSAMESLIELGFKRILSSGQAPNVIIGKEKLKSMNEAAQGRIEIMPGGGLKPFFLAELLEYTGVSSVHMNLRRPVRDASGDMTNGIHFGGALYPAENLYDVIDSEKVRQISSGEIFKTN
ncbi:MAG: copper homeostasis protein CutC [Eubacteriales bacterium]|nr:copper homeostasis protein CutC [Eubacteriales bacterium]